MVRQMQVEAGLEDTEIFLALIKLLLILTWSPQVCFASVSTDNIWSGWNPTQCYTAGSGNLFTPSSPVSFLYSFSLSWPVCTIPFVGRRQTMTEKSGAFMKKWSNRSKQKGRGWSARYLISLGWSQTFSVLKQTWWPIWPRTALTVLAVVCTAVSLPLQEALRHERSNLLQKELRSKEQELEKILYRQKKVTRPKSFLKQYISFYCLPAKVFPDWEWFSSAEGLYKLICC